MSPLSIALVIEGILGALLFVWALLDLSSSGDASGDIIGVMVLASVVVVTLIVMAITAMIFKTTRLFRDKDASQSKKWTMLILAVIVVLFFAFRIVFSIISALQD